MWEQIRRNRRRSAWLLLGMSLLLAVTGFVLAEFYVPGAGPIGSGIGLAIFLIQLLVYRWGEKSMFLSGLGARELPREECPKLHNIVEEMKIASGFPGMPKVYVIDDPAPNALAFGHRPNRCGVAVTTGLLTRLTRDQLQGVIGHEMAHLKNRDTNFMGLAAAMVGSIVLLSEIGGRMLRGGGRGSRRSDARGGGQAALIIAVVAIVLMILGPLLARLFYFACSRRREYLADACAAQFTRYPEGLAGALEQIAANHQPLATANQLARPLFIVPAVRALNATSIFATHPPLTQRVEILRGMGGGASLAAYDAAARQVRGRGVMGTQTVTATAEPIAVRAASDEGPVLAAREAKANTYRAAGYREWPCDCGALLRVAPTFTLPTIHCCRCGKRHPVPETGVPAHA